MTDRERELGRTMIAYVGGFLFAGVLMVTARSCGARAQPMPAAFDPAPAKGLESSSFTDRTLAARTLAARGELARPFLTAPTADAERHERSRRLLAALDRSRAVERGPVGDWVMLWMGTPYLARLGADGSYHYSGAGNAAAGWPDEWTTDCDWRRLPDGKLAVRETDRRYVWHLEPAGGGWVGRGWRDGTAGDFPVVLTPVKLGGE